MMLIQGLHTSIGLMMAGLSMLNALPERWALWIFVIVSFISAVIYAFLFCLFVIKKSKKS